MLALILIVALLIAVAIYGWPNNSRSAFGMNTHQVFDAPARGTVGYRTYARALRR